MRTADGVKDSDEDNNEEAVRRLGTTSRGIIIWPVVQGNFSAACKGGAPCQPRHYWTRAGTE